MAFVLGTDLNDYIVPSSTFPGVTGVPTAGADTIDGGAGTDTMNGGDGNDTYVVDNPLDVVFESYDDIYAGTSDVVQASVSYTLGSGTVAGSNGFGIENLTLTGTANIKGVGNAKNNILKGNAGDNTLDGGAGADTMNGGDGNDIFIVDDVSDVVTEDSDNLTSGTSDTVRASVSYILASGMTAGSNGFGIENLTLTGTANISATGNAKNNLLIGNVGENTLDGGIGVDTMDGGDGNDLYDVDNALDVVAERNDSATGGAADTVRAWITYALGSGTTPGSNGFGIENLLLMGNADINATGNATQNVITGNSGKNILDGGAGADVMNGADGDDTYIVDDPSDVVAESNDDFFAGTADTVQASVSYALGNGTTAGSNGFGIENLTLTGAANLTATGNVKANILTGNSGANTLYGGPGNDTLNGGVSTDAALSSAASADTMYGGDGDDTYIVDNPFDLVYETLDDIYGGTADTVLASVSYNLLPGTKAGTNGFAVENLTLTGTANIKAVGNLKNNILRGNTGDNTLDGGAGVDTMDGGAGNDIYIVDNVSDVVAEFYDQLNSGSSDTVLAAVSYTLGSTTTPGSNGYGIENLTLTGVANLTATGNAKDNALTGNSGANTLNGGIGVDTMNGGDGNDIYYVDNSLDVVTESSDTATAGASDTVWAWVSYTLGSGTSAGANGFGIENILLMSYTDINATGNDKKNILTGNSGNNILNGGPGADVMNGATGNDIYVVDDPLDVVGENYDDSFGGTADTVQASVSYALGTGTTAGSNGFGIENLTLTGIASINGTGNAKENILTGNTGPNVLYGSVGNDTLNGAGGVDTANYSSIGTAVTIGAFNYVKKGGFGTDSLISIETVVGSSLQGDTIDHTGVSVAQATDTVTNLTTGKVLINGTTAPLPFSYTVSSFENVIGSSLPDTITGNIANNSLVGGAGNDIISAGDGDDVMNGGDGKDLLTGGAGTDKFIYTSLVDSLLASHDVIADYSVIDVIDSPGFGGLLKSSAGTASKMDAATISSFLNPVVFPANIPIAFNVPGYAGTFVAFNDATAGFNASTDAIIFLSGYSLSSLNPITVV